LILLGFAHFAWLTQPDNTIADAKSKRNRAFHERSF
jgi:hypothetical protein